MEVGLKTTFPVISSEPEVAATIHLHLVCGHISAFKRAQDCPNRFSHLREKAVSLMEVGLKTTFPAISPEPEVTRMIHLHLICGHISAFKRAQGCPNRLSHLREKDVSLMEVGLTITFPVISPEPEVAAKIRLHLFNGPIVPFE